MRKIVLFNMVTADGFFEGRNNDISWHRVDGEVNEFITEQMKATDTILFGRKTFEVMENFRPTKKAFEDDPVVAKMMGQYLKIVFSTTRHKTSWGNTRFVQENVLETVREIKSMRGKDVFVFGSSDLCKTLIKHGLADEFRLMVNPVVLGKGKRLFHERMNWQLLKTKIFGNGNVLLCYRIAG